MSAEATAQLPRALYTAEQVRAVDRRAIEGLGLGGGTLMERAGAAAYRALRAGWPGARRLAVVAGAGNNGGDGYVVARLACQGGLAARVLALGDPGRLRGDALVAATRAREAGVPVEPFSTGALEGADLLVDALFGTGLDRPVEGAAAEALRAINAAGRPVLSVDIPSGLHADTGRVLGVAAVAAATTTFVALKRGLFTGQGPAHCGRVLFHGLGVPAEAFAGLGPEAVRLEGEALARELLGPRRRDAHKGDFGHVLVVGGDHGYAGAAHLAAHAAARCGAGLVTIATRASHAVALVATRPELMARGVESAEQLEPLLARASVVALGPGLGRGEWGRALAAAVLERPTPRVVDADGLQYLPARGEAEPLQVLTPHPGEAGRMLGIPASEVQGDRFSAAARLRERFGGVVVLKGAGTLVAGSDGPVAVCDRGNPGMATGGMGDVLTGIVAGLLAQGLAPSDAARLGVWLHARAADAAAQEEGERGLLASDLLRPLRRLVNPPRARR